MARSVLLTLDRVLTHTIQAAVAVAFLCLMGLSAGQALMRNLSISVPGWMDPFSHRMVLWVGFLGAVLAVRAHRHIKLDLAAHLVPERLKRPVDLLIAFVSAGLCLLLAKASWTFVLSERDNSDASVMGVPGWIYASVIPLTFALMGLQFALGAFLDRHKPPHQLPLTPEDRP